MESCGSTCDSLQTNCEIHILWLEHTMGPTSLDFQFLLKHLELKSVEIMLFDDSNDCVDHISDFHGDDCQMFLIISDNSGYDIIENFFNLKALNSILLLNKDCLPGFESENRFHHTIKLIGVYRHISDLCRCLDVVLRNYSQTLSPMKLLSKDLDSLNASYMYIMNFKNALFNINDDENSRCRLLQYWRHTYCDNQIVLKQIHEFQQKYQPIDAIRWYAKATFVYQLVNKALRNLDGSLLICMTFYIRDLHRKIETLYRIQRKNHRKSELLLYRAQKIDIADINKLAINPNLLISFNSLLSTSLKKNAAEMFLDKTSTDS